ncbi:MAG: DUF393 domain-containing protein [Candidatus Omnitrophica bacterium]|nr:DUF393 domain-containing protein [Candidatus Omnitrophota bacterium]MCB9720240.1 DUF393 domain-containing protein [Candidatus Omnitrophota bacterium]
MRHAEGRQRIQQLVVLYDDECPFCIRCMEWLRVQSAFIPFRFLPLHAEYTRRLYPELKGPIEYLQFIVVTDEGSVYYNTDARIMCLWALRRYRRYAMVLARPAFKPAVDKVFRLISENRMTIGNLLRLKKEFLAEDVCGTDACSRTREVPS